MKKIVCPVVDDLKCLESVDGLRINDITLHGTLVLFSVDYLGAHSISGLNIFLPGSFVDCLRKPEQQTTILAFNQYSC